MRIEQNTVYAKGLLAEVHGGKLVPAAFQRPYVWRQADVLALFESILREYPLGGLLLWTPSREESVSGIARPRLGPVSASAAQHPTLLLDGQNRLASLAWAMHGGDLSGFAQSLSEVEAQTWAGPQTLAMDLISRQVLFVDREKVNQGAYAPIGWMVDSRIAQPGLRQRYDQLVADFGETSTNAALNWIDAAQAAFSGARFIVTHLEGATREQAQDAFLHICRVGVPMSPEDFQTAVGWSTNAVSAA